MPKHTPFVRLVSCSLIAAISVLSPFGSLLARANEVPVPTNPIVIGEVAWAGSSLSTSDEWIELWNTGDATTSIAGWSLRSAGDAGKTIFFSATSTIPAHGVFIISNYASSDLKSALNVPINVVTTTVSLSNSTLKIDLVDGFGAVIDTTGGSGAPPAGASLPIKTSMIRDVTGGWVNATSSYGMKPNLPDLGTPGMCDGCIVPEEPTVEPLPEPEPMPAATSTEPAPSTTSTEALPTPVETVATDTADMPPPLPPADEVPVTTPMETTDTDTTVISADETDVDMPTVEPEAATETTPEISTEMQPDPIPNETTTTAATAQTVSSSPEPDPVPVPAPPNYAMLRLNEIMANPSSGKEWVEIVSLDATNRIPLDGCELHDATGRILTIVDKLIDPATSTYVVVELSSARLNNDGDSVSLYSPTGQMLDAMTYGNSTKGDPWIRYPDKTGGWQTSTVPTTAAANVLPIIEPEPMIQTVTLQPVITPTPVSSPIPVAVTPITVAAPKTPKPKTTKVVQTAPTPKTPAKTTPTTTASTKTGVPKATKKTVVAKTSAAPKPKAKTTTAKSPEIIPLTFDMRTSDEYGNLRVQLFGTVGSEPGLLTSHAFVLHSPDGRGLLVSLPTSHKLPPMGADVSVIGTLHFDNNNLPSLKLGTKDNWTLLPTSTESVAPRIVDLTSPTGEDAWSLIQVTGTVTSVKGETVHLDLEDAEIDLFIRPVADYRAKRLLPGDVLHIKGILDTTHTAPRILPRAAEDIVLVSHKELKASGQAPMQAPTLPPWTPLGAAAGAVAVTEGAKQIHRRKRQKDLSKKLSEMTAATVIQDW